MLQQRCEEWHVRIDAIDPRFADRTLGPGDRSAEVGRGRVYYDLGKKGVKAGAGRIADIAEAIDTYVGS
jgi:hypothetical protein